MRTRTPQIVTALAVGALVLAPSMPASAASADSPVPIGSATTLTVTGHGWGHAHGMSQYGAQGAARQGLTYAQILQFYYPGTALSSFTGKVRVLITGDTDNNTTVRTTRGLRLTDTGRGKTWNLPTSKHPKAWRLRVRNGHIQVLYRTGSWHRFHPGGHATLAGDGQFSSSSGPVTLRLPSGDRAYRGALRLTHRDTVNVVGIEKYLRGVVPSEMPPSWKPAALQAQAVAARTYAAFERAASASYFHVYDTTQSQVYKGVSAEASTATAAIAATAGRILTYGGAPAFTQFSSSSGGWTSAGSQPYLVAKQDIYDKPVDTTTNTGDPHFNWTVSLGTAAIQKAYPQVGTLQQVQITVREGNRTFANGGRVESILLTGSGGTLPVPGSDFRSKFGLKSTYFTLTSP